MQQIADEKIDVYADEIRASVSMDQIRWREADSAPFDFDYEIERVREFVLARKQFLDEIWIGQEELCTVTFVSETGDEHYVSVIAGKTLDRLPGSEPGTVSGDRVFDGWYTQEGEMLDTETPVCEDITVYSKSHGV